MDLHIQFLDLSSEMTWNCHILSNILFTNTNGLRMEGCKCLYSQNLCILSILIFVCVVDYCFDIQ